MTNENVNKLYKEKHISKVVKGVDKADALYALIKSLKSAYGNNSFLVTKILSCELVKNADIARQCTTAATKYNGAKKFITKFKLMITTPGGRVYQHSEIYDMEGPALAEAKEIARTKLSQVDVIVYKELANGSDVTKKVNPKIKNVNEYKFDILCLIKLKKKSGTKNGQ